MEWRTGEERKDPSSRAVTAYIREEHRLHVVYVPGPVCEQVGDQQNSAAHSAHMHHQ